MTTSHRHRPDTSVLRQQVREELLTAHKVIAALNKDLAARRQEVRLLNKERDHLLHMLAQVDIVRLERANVETRWQTGRREQQGLEQSNQTLTAENRDLQARCALLDEELEIERNDSDTAALEILCLEEQITQLKSIVALLSQEPETEA